MYIVTTRKDIWEAVNQMAENYEYWHEGKDLMGDDSTRKGHLLGFTTDLGIDGPRFGEDWEDFLAENCTVENFNRYMDAKFKD